MIHLDVVVSNEIDNAIVMEICEDAKWSSLEEDWLHSYEQYRIYFGDPWFIEPLLADEEIKSSLYKLYDSRRSSLPLTAIRNTKGLLSCPMCGSPATGSLDHYLPRDHYPEFSIMRANLVPACMHCNSSGKGTTYKGSHPERFIHPYYDNWANEAIWAIEIIRPLESAIFAPVPIEDLRPNIQSIITFHLKNVLGEQFDRSLYNIWSTLPNTLKTRYPDVNSFTAEVILKRELNAHVVCYGVNSWHAAFFRGLLADKEAIDYIWNLVNGISENYDKV